MLSQSKLQCPSNITNIANTITQPSKQYNTFRRCNIHEPARIQIHSDFLYEDLIPGWIQPYTVIADNVFKGAKVTLDIDISIEEALTSCLEYYIPVNRFITYEESDIDWLLYCGIAKEYKQPISNADIINVTFYKNGQFHSVKTKLSPLNTTNFYKNNYEKFITISLTVLAN